MDYPDNTPRVLPPVTLDNIGGNHVILKIAPNRYVTYAHLQHGSLKVHLHDHVHTGDALALLGNNGNTTGAHLHMQVTDRGSMLEAEGVPFEFASFTYLGPGADYELDKHVIVPWTHSIPAGMAQFGSPRVRRCTLLTAWSAHTKPTSLPQRDSMMLGPYRC